MAIDKEAIEKYIFDPENPTGCKSYKLLLNVVKEGSHIYIDSNYLSFAYKKTILNDDFYRKLWDKPNNFDGLSFNDKIKVFKDNLSNNDYINHIESLNINEDNSIYSHIFKSFFDFHVTNNNIQIKTFTQYPKDLIKAKFKDKGYSLNYSVLVDRQVFRHTPIPAIHHKILITDNIEVIKLNSNFYDISSIIITNIQNRSQFYNSKVNSYVKPIFLKKIEDIDLLLNVLENDLTQITKQNKPKEKIATLNALKIKNVFSIKQEIRLHDLKDKKEIYIVGENGDGKTLLLQAIALGLKGTAEDGLKSFRDIEKSYTIEIEDRELCQNNFLAYGALRNSVCQMKEDKTGFLTLFSGEYDLKSPIDWLLALDYSEKSGNTNVISVEEAKKLLQKLLNSDIEIDIVPPNQVTFTEKGSIVDFQQLSAGYKGVITIVCDLIYRLSEKQEVENITELQGIVLIDEVELHLHPTWSYGFMKKLRDTFPLIQFIVTTHSPSVILGAGVNAVFYKIYKEEGEVRISQPMDNIKNLMANNLSTSPLFDMSTARARNSDDNIDTSDDFIYTKIHENISKRVEDKKGIIEEDIVMMVDEELDIFLEENGL